MAEYIERERLRGMLKDHYYPTDQEHEYDRQWAVGFNAGLDKALHKIRYAPAADVAPVVRCKDCEKREICRTSTIWAVAPPDNWFCADGERRGENGAEN